MWDFFKSFLKRSDSRNVSATRPEPVAPAPVSLEASMAALAELGIKPCVDFFEKWVVSEWGENPEYDLILTSLGGDGEAPDGGWIRLSHDVYRFDTECIVDDSSYPEILKNLSDLTGGELAFEQIESRIDHDEETAALHFVCRGVEHDMELEYNDDWFDINVLHEIDRIIVKDDDDRRFYKYSPDQTITLVYKSWRTTDRLNQLAGVDFQ